MNSSQIKTARRKKCSKISIRFILVNSKNVSSGPIDEGMFNSAVRLLKDNKKAK